MKLRQIPHMWKAQEEKKRSGTIPQTCNSWMALRWVSIVLLFSWSLLSICTVSESVWTFQQWIFSTSSNSLENSCAWLQLVWEISTNREVNWQVSELTVHSYSCFTYLHSKNMTSSFSIGDTTFILVKALKGRKKLIRRFFIYMQYMLYKFC